MNLNIQILLQILFTDLEKKDQILIFVYFINPEVRKLHAIIIL